MKKRSMKNISLLILFVIYMIVYRLFIFNNFMKYSEMINASFLVLLTFLATTLLGFRKDKPTYIKKNIFKIILVYLAFTFLIMYGLGTGIGFLKNAYSLSPFSILDNIFAPIIIIIFSELFRYTVIEANKDKKIFPYLFTIVLIIFEIVISVNSIDFFNLKALFRLTASLIIPITIKNGVLSYLCYQVGYKPPILYRLIMDIYIFVVPYIPDLGEYLNSMILITVPTLIYISSFSLIEEYEKGVEHIFIKDDYNLLDIPITVVMITLICLISGFFPYFMLGVGSDSMNPQIKRGDAVILSKVSKQEKLKKGEIIAYQKDNIIVVHRIMEIKKENGKIYYITKGDANKAEDPKKVKVSQIKGKVKAKIPIIAYPSIWLTNLFNKQE